MNTTASVLLVIFLALLAGCQSTASETVKQASTTIPLIQQALNVAKTPVEPSIELDREEMKMISAIFMPGAYNIYEIATPGFARIRILLVECF